MRWTGSRAGGLAAGIMMLAAASAAAQSSLPRLDMVRVKVGDGPGWSDPTLDDSDWERVHWQRIDSQRRLLWMRAHVELPARFDRDAFPLAVHVSALAAYEVYWNGVFLGASGEPGASPADEMPGLLDTIHYVPPRLVRDGENVLALRMSTFHLRRVLAAPFQFIAIEEYGRPARRMVMARVPMLVAAGALLLGAAYFGVLFVSNRRDYASLLLSLIALSVLAQLVAESIRSFFLSYLYPLQILRLEVILAAASATGLLLVLYSAARYARARLRALLAAAIVLMSASVWLVPGFDGKTALVIVSALLVVIVAAVMGVRARVRGARATAAAATTVVALFALDPARFIDQTYYLAATAFLVFLFAQQVMALRSAEETRTAAQLRSARLELELLKRQIQPHFLMNSLTAATELMEAHPETGVRMIEALAEELRALSAMSDKTVIPIEDELALCRRHLEVMSYRRDCAFSLTVEGVAPGARVPPGVFHTLLENALTHNVYERGAVFRLETTRAASGRTAYRLRSPRAGATVSGGDGKGHEYVRARLQEAFGNDWSFAAGPCGNEWVDVVEVPSSAPVREVGRTCVS